MSASTFTMAVLALGMTINGAMEVPIGTTADDLQLRSRQMHWPQGFHPVEAQSFAHNDLLIRSDCSKVWSHLVDVAQWPTWLNITKHTKYLNGATELAHGTIFQWNILSYEEESKIEEFVPNARLGWYSYNPGQPPLYYHAWLLEPKAQGCLVTTEEVGIGLDAAKSAKAGDTETHRAHDLWLASLRWVSGS